MHGHERVLRCHGHVRSKRDPEQALALGVTLFDTADMYGLGANESFLAPFVKANRRRVVIATKFGYTRSVEQPDDWSLSNRPEYIRQAVDQSLLRLGIETIDLYYMHRRTPDVPLEDSIGAMEEPGEGRQGACAWPVRGQRR